MNRHARVAFAVWVVLCFVVCIYVTWHFHFAAASASDPAVPAQLSRQHSSSTKSGGMVLLGHQRERAGAPARGLRRARLGGERGGVAARRNDRRLERRSHTALTATPDGILTNDEILSPAAALAPSREPTTAPLRTRATPQFSRTAFPPFDSGDLRAAPHPKRTPVRPRAPAPDRAAHSPPPDVPEQRRIATSVSSSCPAPSTSSATPPPSDDELQSSTVTRSSRVPSTPSSAPRIFAPSRDAATQFRTTTSATAATAVVATSRLPHATDQVAENPLLDVNRGKELGQGAFGKVYEGTLKGKTVAIKTFKEGYRAELEVEVAVMKMVKHERIVQFIGECKLDGAPGLVMEFAENGSLDNYLKENSSWLCTVVLVRMSRHVAEGLAYLHSERILHLDLAARNVLVVAAGSCKLADFGLARVLGAGETVEAPSVTAVRWSAPEVLRDHVATLQSDCYSLAMTMIEVFSRGTVLPFREYADNAVKHQVLSGERPSAPPGCPDKVSEIMASLWVQEAGERMSAANAVAGLSESLEELGEPGAATLLSAVSTASGTSTASSADAGGYV